MAKKSIVPDVKIDRAILLLRGKRVLLDADLALIFGTTTKRINESVKRNLKRFPPGFVFQLTEEERNWVVANCDHLKQLRFSPVRPYAFTEHGTIMVATILNTPVAINASVQVVKGFVKFREILTNHGQLLKKLNSLEAKYDHKFRIVFEAVRKLMGPSEKQTKRIRIGYRRSGDKD